jgi:hypothetical protein
MVKKTNIYINNTRHLKNIIQKNKRKNEIIDLSLL